MKSQILELVQKHNLAEFADRIMSAIAPAIHISKQASAELAIGASRIGGLPDVPRDFQWKSWQECPLSFLAQINCADLQSFSAAKNFPAAGMLYFFYDAIEQPWGFDPSDRGSSAIIYHPSTDSLVPSTLPEGADIDNGWLFEPSAIQFREILTLPSYQSLAFERMVIPKDSADDYINLVEDVSELMSANEPLHRLFGHSANIQGDMQLECQLASHGLNCGDASGYNDPIATDLTAGAFDWSLLLQLASDDDLEMMWGDMGMLYFWIRDTDLQAQLFDRAWTILQCY